MKSFLAVLLLITILAGTRALAVTPYFGATVNGVLTTEVLISASTSKFVSIPINDATITNALFKTGTSGVLKAADMAVVFGTNGFGLTIINTSNRAELYQLAYSGSDQLETTATLAPTLKVVSYTVNASDVNFIIPVVTGANPPTFVGPIITNWIFRETVRSAISTLPSSITGLFTGGSGTGGGGATLFKGSVFFNGRRY
jgi:hypothetical protein